MSPKKIWVLSMVIASVFTIVFYFYLSKGENQQTPENKSENVASAQKTNTNKAAQPNNNEKLKISPNKRAISIAVDQVKGVSGLIRPGNYVDVIAFIPESPEGPATTEILLQDIKVLAVGSQTDKTIKSIDPAADLALTYPSVTVEVTPEQAVSIATVSVKGSLTFMLRKTPKKGETQDAN